MAAALESLNGFCFVCVLMFLCLCEWESRPILDDWLVTQRKREIKWWWLNHERQHYTLSLSRTVRARVRRATLPSWDRYRCVPQSNDRERVMLIVLCYWLCLQLLHVDLIIKRTLFFQHNINKRIVKHQHHQPQHPLTRSHNNHNSTEIEREREREREREQYLCLGCWVVRLSWCCVSTNQRTTTIKLVTWLIDWIYQSSSSINHV